MSTSFWFGISLVSRIKKVFLVRRENMNWTKVNSSSVCPRMSRQVGVMTRPFSTALDGLEGRRTSKAKKPPKLYDQISFGKANTNPSWGVWCHSFRFYINIHWITSAVLSHQFFFWYFQNKAIAVIGNLFGFIMWKGQKVNDNKKNLNQF